MHLSVIIVTYNSNKYIEDCLRSIIKNIDSFVNYEIIIIDNASQDNTIKLIEDFQNDKVRLLKRKSNKGYSNSINKAVKIATFENILILNPDTILKEASVVNLISFFDKPDFGIVGAKLLNLDGSFQLSSRRHFPTLGVLISYFFRLNKLFKKSTFFGKYNYTYASTKLPMEVDSVSGACMLFSKKTYYKVKGFDENFFIYFEDTDFCLKVKDAGLKVMYCPEAEVLHYNNYSDNYNLKTFYFYESFEKFIYKYKHKIYLGLLVYYLAKLIKSFFYLKRQFLFKNE